MSVERWRMPSGRIATIDLAQQPAAIDDARRLLREFGDAELINEETPAATGAQNQNPISKKENQNMANDTNTAETTEDAYDEGPTVSDLVHCAELLRVSPGDLLLIVAPLILSNRKLQK